MKLKIALIFVVLSMASAGCGEYTGTPTEFAQVCNTANDKKMIETQGFLTTGVSVLCSSRGGTETCGLSLKQNPSDEKGISADVETGSGANTMDKLGSGYKKEDLKIRDKAGNAVTPNDKVKVTGEIMAVPNSLNPQETVCVIKVKKIEK